MEWASLVSEARKCLAFGKSLGQLVTVEHKGIGKNTFWRLAVHFFVFVKKIKSLL